VDWMNWNICFAAAIGLLTVVVAGLAGHLAAAPFLMKDRQLRTPQTNIN